MKKSLYILLFLIISIILVSGCKKKTLPMPEYPLDAATVNSALEEAELSWTIVKEESWSEGKMVYTLHDKDDKIIAFVLSGIQNERRVLDASFMPYYDNQTITRSLPEEEWERAIIFATILYGGFESKQLVYDSFTKDFDTKNTVTGQHVKIDGIDKRVNDGEVATWESQINDIYCRVRIEKPNVNLLQKRYLTTVRFDNIDSDALKH